MSKLKFNGNNLNFIQFTTPEEQAKGLHITDSNELKYLFDSLKALMQTDEPLINTHNEAKPLIDECTMALKSLGDFAKTITFK